MKCSKFSVQGEYGREKELKEMVLSPEKARLKSPRRGHLKKLRQQITPHNVEKRKMEDKGRKGEHFREKFMRYFSLGTLGFLESFKFWLQEREFPREPSCQLSCRSSLIL